MSRVLIGNVKGKDGDAATIEVASDTDTEYTLDITTKDGVITTPNLRDPNFAILETQLTGIQEALLTLDKSLWRNGSFATEASYPDKEYALIENVTNRLVSNRIFTTTNPLTVTMSPGYKLRLLSFDLSTPEGQYRTYVGWTNEYTLTPPPEGRYYMFHVGKEDDSKISINELEGAITFAPKLEGLYTYSATQNELYQLAGSFEDFKERIDSGLLNLNLWSRKTFSLSNNTYSFLDTNTRITSARLPMSSMEVTANEGYLFRSISIEPEEKDNVYVSAVHWINYHLYEPSVPREIIIAVKREDESEIAVGELLNAITITPKDGNKFYTNAIHDNVAYLNNETLKIENMLSGLEVVEGEDNGFITPTVKPYIDNCSWSWWLRPNIATFTNLNAPGKKAFFGYVDSAGMAGVGEIDRESGRVKRHELMYIGKDDHNAPSVLAHSNGRLYVFITGHNTTKELYLYIGYSLHSGDYYFKPITIHVPGSCSYSQVFDYSSKLNSLWLFSRVSTNNWYLIKSNSAYADTWGNATPVVTSNRQYYVKFAQISGNNYLRMVMYSNPNISNYDTNIRMGYIDLNTGDILNSDCATVLGNINDGTGVNFSNFDIVIEQPEGKRSRLLDVVENSPTSNLYIAYAQFTDTTDVEYFIYYNGTTIKVCDGGRPFYTSSVYVGGVCFNQRDKNIIYVSRTNNNDVYVIEEYRQSNGQYNLKRTVSEGTKSYSSQKLIRPITDSNARVLIWQNGRYSNNYTNYDLAAEYEYLGD